MLNSMILLFVASIPAGLLGQSSDAESAPFGEPPTLELALAGIATLLVYSLARRSFWRRKRVADTYARVPATDDVAAALEEPSRDAA